ncbi:MAG: fibronectin type III domain-containing protein, partial [bacterium]
MKKYVSILVGLLLLLPVIARAFPFKEDFENTDCSFDIIPSSGWGVMREHGAWSTFRGERHLDNNIHETYQYKNYNRETVICAKMKQHIKISSYSSTPILSYWYKSNLAADDRIYVDIYYIQENFFGRKKERVDRLRVYREWENTGEFYAWEKISLKKYRGKEMWVMFKQRIGKDGPGGVFVVDDFQINQLPAHDTDNDTIPDAYDPTPNNEILPPVKNLRAINVGTEEVHLLWSPIEDEPLLAGYRIYRRKDGEIREVMLNHERLLHPQQTSFIDHDIQNATGYHYRAVAVSKEGHEGERATPADVFVYVKYDQVLEFPFEESFDSINPNFIIPKGSGWAIAHDHHGWNSFSGTSHLDTNPSLDDQRKVFGSTNSIRAMMKKRVYIPSHITSPFLSYWYTMNLNKRELKYKEDSVFWKFLDKIGLLNLLNDIV